MIEYHNTPGWSKSLPSFFNAVYWTDIDEIGGEIQLWARDHTGLKPGKLVVEVHDYFDVDEGGEEREFSFRISVRELLKYLKHNFPEEFRKISKGD